MGTARRLPEFRRQVADLEAQLERLRPVLPSEKDVAELLRRIQGMATQSNLTIRGFAPQAVATRQMYAEWPIGLQIEGTYHNLALFFDRMSRFSRIINVEALKIGGLENVPGKSIGANFVAKTFIYTGDETGQTTAAGGAAPAAAPTPTGGKPPAAKSAQTMKERAEGKGVE